MSVRREPLHILASNHFSGAENVAVGLILEEGGAYCSPDGPIRGTLKARGVNYVGLARLNFKEVRSVVASLKPSTIYAHDFRASLLMGLYFGGKYKVISYIHQNPEWLDTVGVRTLLYKMVMSRFDKIIVVSDSIADRRLLKGCYSDKVVVRYNRVDEQRIKRLARDGVGKQYDLCFVGRLSDVKQPEHFVRLISRVKRAVPGVAAVMVGDGELNESVRQLVRKLKLEKSIDMVGFQENPYKYIAASKVLVLTSKSEGLPMVVLEAVALGKCVLSYSYPTLEKLFTAGGGEAAGICADADDMRVEAGRLISDGVEYKNTVRVQAARVNSLYGLGI